MLQQSDGKLVIAGDSEVVRYNIDGSLDTTFAGKGRTSICIEGFARRPMSTLESAPILGIGGSEPIPSS